jgi:carbonic anhydrase/acetyltransferase-like protein (isoleucine patch superfamily)
MIHSEETSIQSIVLHKVGNKSGDEGLHLFVGEESNIQDGVVLHALETGPETGKNLVEVESREYAVYVGKRVSLAHQVLVHGPAVINDDTFVGMQSQILMSRIGSGCVIEPKCLVMGVEIKAGRYVPAGSVVKSQEDADNLPQITDGYRFKSLNSEVVKVNIALAEGYRKMEL